MLQNFTEKPTVCIHRTCGTISFKTLKMHWQTLCALFLFPTLNECFKDLPKTLNNVRSITKGKPKIYIHTYLAQTPEIGQGLGRFSKLWSA